MRIVRDVEHDIRGTGEQLEPAGEAGAGHSAGDRRPVAPRRAGSVATLRGCGQRFERGDGAGGDPPATKPEDPPAKPEAAPSKPEPAPPKKETAPPKATVNEAKSAEISAKSKPASGGEPAPAKAASSSSTKSVASASPAESFAVQIGAFASEKGAKEQAARAGKTGLKVYTERIKTSSGVRIRVRVGPFKTREQAEAARVKLRAAGIESAIIAP